MEKDTDITKVIFKKFPNGDVIACFPELLGNCNAPETCTAYEHIGQHGSADVGYMASLRPAHPNEYHDLLQELESLGYNLKIVRKFTRQHQSIRNLQTIRMFE